MSKTKFKKIVFYKLANLMNGNLTLTVTSSALGPAAPPSPRSPDEHAAALRDTTDQEASKSF